MSLEEALRFLIPDISSIDEQPISNICNEVVGWHSYVRTKSGYPVAGGTNRDRITARRIGIAEAFERALAYKISIDSDLNVAFMVDRFPSTCGFAAGFNCEKAKLRSICEAIERWAWSQWIDFKGAVPPAEIKGDDLSELSLLLKQSFQFTQAYEKKINWSFGSEDFEVWFGVFLGFKDNGVFAGSRVAFTKSEIWNHSVTEAYRNFKNCEFYKSNPAAIDPGDLIASRVRFFSENSCAALNSIANAKCENWPKPSLILLKQYNTHIDNLYLWRSLASDYLGWHIGDETRFVY